MRLKRSASRHSRPPLDRGESALQQGDSKTRRPSFRAGPTIRPGDSAAQHGARRATTLDAVFALLAEREGVRATRADRRGRCDLSEGGGARSFRPLARRRARREPAAAAGGSVRPCDGARIRGDRAAPAGGGTRCPRGGQKSSPTIRRSHEPPHSCRPWTPPRNWRAALAQARWLRASEHWQEAVTQYQHALALDSHPGRCAPFAAGRRRSCTAGWRAATNHCASRAHLQRCGVCRGAHQSAAGAGHIAPPGPVLSRQIGQVPSCSSLAATPCGCHVAFRQSYERRRCIGSVTFGQLYAARVAAQARPLRGCGHAQRLSRCAPRADCGAGQSAAGAVDPMRGPDMSVVLEIYDSLGKRAVEREDFPLALGGPGSAVVVDPSATGPLAWVGLEDDALFVQPTGSGSLLHNGTAVQGSTWLQAGDVISVGAVLIRLSNRDGIRRLEVDDGGAGNVTAPPVLERDGLISGGTSEESDALVSMKYRRTQAASTEAFEVQARSGTDSLIGDSDRVDPVVSGHRRGRANQSAAGKRTGACFRLMADAAVRNTAVRATRALLLRAQAPGYQTAQREFVAGEQAARSWRYSCSKLPGRVRVELAALGLLHLDNRDAIPVPAIVDVPAGKHTVLIEAGGFLPYRGDIDVQGEGKVQTYAPRLLANSALVSIGSRAERRTGPDRRSAHGCHAGQCEAGGGHSSGGAAPERVQALDDGSAGQGRRAADHRTGASGLAGRLADGAYDPGRCARDGRWRVSRRYSRCG